MMTTWMFCWREPGRLEDRLRIVAQHLLDLGVADDRQPPCALRLRRTGGDSRPRTPWQARSARAAGLNGRTLIGVFGHVALELRSAWPQTSEPTPVRSTQAAITSRWGKLAGRKPANAAGAGRAGFRQRRRGRLMLDTAQTVACALGPQRRAAVHGHGRDGGGGANRGAGRPRHPHGGRPAGGAGAATAIAAAQAALAVGRVRYTEALGIPSLRAADRAALCRELQCRRRRRARDRHHRLVGRIHPRVPRAVRAGRSRRASPRPAIRRTATSSRRSAASRC